MGVKLHCAICKRPMAQPDILLCKITEHDLGFVPMMHLHVSFNE